MADTEKTTQPADQTYEVPALRLSACPWCKYPANRFFLLAYVRDGATDFEVMCEKCSAAAFQFAQMRRDGLRRQQILEDFGFRGRDAPWPKLGT